MTQLMSAALPDVRMFAVPDDVAINLLGEELQTLTPNNFALAVEVHYNDSVVQRGWLDGVTSAGDGDTVDHESSCEPCGALCSQHLQNSASEAGVSPRHLADALFLAAAPAGSAAGSPAAAASVVKQLWTKRGRKHRTKNHMLFSARVDGRFVPLNDGNDDAGNDTFVVEVNSGDKQLVQELLEDAAFRGLVLKYFLIDAQEDECVRQHKLCRKLLLLDDVAAQARRAIEGELDVARAASETGDSSADWVALLTSQRDRLEQVTTMVKQVLDAVEDQQLDKIVRGAETLYTRTKSLMLEQASSHSPDGVDKHVKKLVTLSRSLHNVHSETVMLAVLFRKRGAIAELLHDAGGEGAQCDLIVFSQRSPCPMYCNAMFQQFNTVCEQLFSCRAAWQVVYFSWINGAKRIAAGRWSPAAASSAEQALADVDCPLKVEPKRAELLPIHVCCAVALYTNS